MNEFFWPVRVYYEDTDSGGVIYNANYLKFMERARTEWLRGMGYEQDALIADEGLIFAVRHTSLDFLRPGRFNDQLSVSVRVIQVGRVTMNFEQEVLRQGDETVLCKGKIKLASLDAESFRPRVLPPHMLEKIQQLIQESRT